MSKLIHTIGYEGLPPADFLALLREAGVKRLVDVRAIANSRRPGYAKRALAGALEQAGIGYWHLPALGTPAAGRQAARAGRTAEMHRIFRVQLATEPAQTALVALADAASGTPCCLLCLEADHRQCHRTIIAEELAGRWQFGIRNLP
jgi:uncharacterized protein (DUF488 family)